MALNKVEICGVNTSSLPVLTSEEKEELFEKIKAGDKEARERYIKGNLRLVLSVIKRFGNSSENADDLFQIGCIGLMKAIDNFDTTLMVRFSTYAVPMIMGEIRRYLRDNSSIRVSRSLRDIAYKAIYAKENYIKKGYEIKDIYHVFENVVSYIPKENLENLNILKIENDKFDMDKFISTVSENLDEAINKNLIAIDMKQSELTPRLYIKADGKTNTKFVVFGTDINSYSQGILCANNEIIKDLDIDMGDVEISNTRDIGYIINEENGYLTFKIANYNSQTSNNNQIAQIVDYSGIFKPMMIDFIKQFVR